MSVLARLTGNSFEIIGFPILIFNSLPILISEDFNKWPKLSPTLMPNMQKRGLAPKEFKASLTKNVNRLLESTGLDRREPFIKDAITQVTTQVYGTRRKTNVKRRRGQSMKGSPNLTEIIHKLRSQT